MPPCHCVSLLFV
uniref:Uncharacterized protein n=1 Tax=Anguilla anguilla TaxID=7936 RepID=A0A0E9PBN6_ANGAN